MRVSRLPTLNGHDMAVKLLTALAGFGASPVRSLHAMIAMSSGLAPVVWRFSQRNGSERTTTQVRSPSPVRSLLAGLVMFVAPLSLAGVGAPTAHVDAIDNNFLGALGSKGINFASPQAAIVAGHEVCDQLDSGRAATDVASDVMNDSNLDGYHAGFFVGVSVAAFCPRHEGQS